MDHYTLQPNEVLLFEGPVYRENDKNAKGEVLLTNLFLTCIIKTKKFLSKEEVRVESFPVQDIKVYNDMPQIKQNGNTVEVYLLSHEEKLNFVERRDANEFVSTAFELLTGKTAAKRGAEKVKGAIGLVNDALGINTVDTVRDVLKNGLVGTVIGGIKPGRNRKNGFAAVASKTLNLTKENLFAANQPVDIVEPETEKDANGIPDNSLDNKMDALIKLKELLDAGILTQEEFDEKKTELLAKL